MDEYVIDRELMIKIIRGIIFRGIRIQDILVDYGITDITASYWVDLERKVLLLKGSFMGGKDEFDCDELDSILEEYLQCYESEGSLVFRVDDIGNKLFSFRERMLLLLNGFLGDRFNSMELVNDPSRSVSWVFKSFYCDIGVYNLMLTVRQSYVLTLVSMESDNNFSIFDTDWLPDSFFTVCGWEYWTLEQIKSSINNGIIKYNDKI